jgi:hypothetical protein
MSELALAPMSRAQAIRYNSQPAKPWSLSLRKEGVSATILNANIIPASFLIKVEDAKTRMSNVQHNLPESIGGISNDEVGYVHAAFPSTLDIAHSPFVSRISFFFRWLPHYNAKCRTGSTSGIHCAVCLNLKLQTKNKRHYTFKKLASRHRQKIFTTNNHYEWSK